MKKMFLWPVVFCGTLAILALSTEKVQAEVGFVPGIGGDFTLTGTDGKLVSLGDFNGRAVLVFFGYTSCPDVCPTAMLTMQTVQELLGEKANQVQIVFITVDPERDTLEKIKSYVAYFGASTIGLRGTPQEIAEVAAKYRVAYKKVEAENAAYYSVDHTDFIYLIDGQGRTRSLYRSTSPVKKMVSDVLELMN
jgi:protein SCO1/2